MDSNNLLDSNKIQSGLSKEELFLYFEKAKLGNKEAREQLIMNNIWLVQTSIANNFGNTTYDYQELLSVGIIGLIEGIDSFNPNDGINFYSHAFFHIDSAIVNFIVNNDKYANDKDLDKEVLLQQDLTSDLLSDYETKEEYQNVRRVIDDLPDYPKKAVMLYYGFIDDKKYTYETASEVLGVKPWIFAKYLNIAREQVKRQLERKNVKIFQLDKTFDRNSKKHKVTNIYEYFRSYTKGQVDKVLLQLPECERKLFEFKRRGYLDQNLINRDWVDEENDKFYGHLIPRMNGLLFKEENKKRVKNKRLTRRY